MDEPVNDEPRIVEAAGISVNSSMSGNKPRAARIEAAMSQAVHDCYADGVTDPVKMKERMMAARQAILDEG